MKKLFTPLCLSVLLSISSAVCATDIKPLSLNESNVNYLPYNYAKSANATAVADVIVFYQPSYATKYGEYDIYRRINEWFNTANESYAAHGLDYKLSIKDIVPVESIPDDVPYEDVLDEDGNIIQDGAVFLFSSAALNPGQPEYDIYQAKWKADLVVYVRERRNGDKSLGQAGIGGEFSTVLDNNVDPKEYTTLAHEVGHSIGMNHEENKAFVGPDYARAWQCGGKTTIMYSSASEGNTLHHYSSPDLSFDGDVCGDSAVADNARVLKENFIPTTQRRSGVASLGNVSFSSSLFNGNEEKGVKISLVRDGDLSQSASVKVFIENGSAVWGEDFSDAFVEVSFAENESFTEVVLPIVNDADVEGQENASIFIQYPYRLTKGSLSTASIIIKDGNNNGFAGQFSISSAFTLVNEGASLDFTVTRSGGIGEVLINVVSENGTAIAGNDFIELNQDLLFLEGEVEKTITLNTINDEMYENNKTMAISISSPSSSVEYLDQEIQITIVDDEPKPQFGEFSLSVNNTSVNEDVGSIVVTVNRDNGSDGEVTLRLYTSDNGQFSGVDYQAVNEVLVFSKGETQKTVEIFIIDESINDGNSSFNVNLESSDAVITTGAISITIQNNDNETPENDSSNSKSSSGGGGMGLISVLLLCLIGFIRRREFIILHGNNKFI